MKTKAIIFDKDGTLLDFEAFWIPVTEKAVDQILLGAKATHVPKEAVYKAYGIAGGVTDITGSLCCGTYDDMTADLQKVLVEYGVDIPYETVKKLTVDAYHNNTSAGEFLPTASNLKSVLESLKEKGAKLKSFAPLRIKLTLEGGTMTEYKIVEKAAFTIMGKVKRFSHDTQ